MQIKMKPPAVGEFIYEEVFLAHAINVTQGAEILGITRPNLSRFLNGKARLSPDMATRLHKAFGFSRLTLLKMQARCDEYEASQNEDNIHVLPLKTFLKKKKENCL